MKCSWRVTLLILGLCAATNAVEAAKKPPCKPTLASCPVDGCPASKGDKKLNTKKNRVDSPAAAEIEDWSVSQVIGLNDETPEKWKKNSQRTPLEEIGEGTAVRVKGWLIDAYVTKTPEDTNCFLGAKDDNDIHMNLGSKKTATSHDAMVVEMTPRFRKAGWTVDKLAGLVDDEDHGPYYVRVTGWLMLDSMHVANTTHASPASSYVRPRRSPATAAQDGSRLRAFSRNAGLPPSRPHCFDRSS